jgi:hypothetical protein
MRHTDSLFQFKSVNDAGVVEGIAAAFGNVDHGGDKLLFGFVTKTLTDRGSIPLPMLLHHDMHRPVGAWTEWREQTDGLHVKGRLSLGTRDGQEAHALLCDGALTGISIGFQIKGTPGRERDGTRSLPEIELFEASLVTVPMNDRARVTSVKSVCSARDIEELLREAGVPSRRAKAAGSAAWRAIGEHGHDAADDGVVAAILTAATKRMANITIQSKGH